MAMAALLLSRAARRRRRLSQTQTKPRQSRVWVGRHLAERAEQGAYTNLLSGLREHEDVQYRNFIRMPPHLFKWLPGLISPVIARQNTNFRDSISPGERLALTLRFLATGETYRSLGLQFRIGSTTIGYMVPTVCQAIYDVLKGEFFKCPTTQEEWRSVADQFQQKWNMPNCLGGLDGKHITTKPPRGSAAKFFKHKKLCSIVLMALVDADYKFLCINVGCNGRISDGGVFESCTLQQALERQSRMFPDPAPCPGEERPLSYYVVADDGFPLQENILRPFSYQDAVKERRVFNYRLSRARRVVDNALGILSNQFRVFLSPITLEPAKVELIVMAACALHNMLRVKVGFPTGLCDHEDEDTHIVTPGTWRNDPILRQASLPAGATVSACAKARREYLVQYLNSPQGALSWQDEMI